jgi:hypothetical protein
MNSKEIKIKNLSEYQVEMLDIMWAIESAEEYVSWFENLDSEDQRLAESLQRLIILETMEEMMNGYKDAKRVLKQFTLGGKK